MYKVGNIQVSDPGSGFARIAEVLEGLQFSIMIKTSNSKQMDSDIDERIIESISQKYIVSTSKAECAVEADGEKVGKLDLVFKDNSNDRYYTEIEKTNKKTLWFDYIKILTKLESDPQGYGVVICPSNYAHSSGVWNLYKEAVVYKNHLKRVFGAAGLGRVAVIGYTQYALLDDKWQEFDSGLVKKIKKL